MNQIVGLDNWETAENKVVENKELSTVEALTLELQFVKLENERLREAIHQSNAEIAVQINNQDSCCQKALKYSKQRLDAFSKSQELQLTLMDEVTTLKNELLVKQNENEDLQRTIHMLQNTLHEALGNSPERSFIPAHIIQLPDNQLDQEKAKCKSLEQQLANLEAKFVPKQEEFFAILGMMNRKLESSEKGRVSLERDLEKVTYQKRALEVKLLSMQSADRPLVPAHVDWFFNTNLWTSTIEFMEASAPGLTLCAGETVESLTVQLKREKIYLKQAKALLSQHQDQLTKLLSASSKPCSCQNKASERIENQDVGNTIETLLEKVQTLQELMSAKDYEINSFRSRKPLQEVDHEKMSILKSQVMVYRTDYIAEKKSKEQVMTELQLVKDENTILRDRLISLGISASHLEVAPHISNETEWSLIQKPPPYSSVLPAVEGPSTSEQQHQFECPNPECLKHFKTLDALQHHVHQCLELSD